MTINRAVNASSVPVQRDERHVVAQDDCGIARWYSILTEFDSKLAIDPDELASRLAELPAPSRRPVAAAIRRTMELAVALTALAVSAPVMLYMAVAIRRDTPGPALFRQSRLGRVGRPFDLVKFRGMFVDARERFPDLYDYRLDKAQAHDYRFHQADDPRVTSAGRRFRRLSVDELPNFWNVVRGDIALVGPRPQIAEMFEYYGPYRDVVLSVKPGIFSLPKVWYRDNLALRDTYMLDAYYAHNRSLKLDAAVVLRGLKTVIARENVH